MQLTAGEYRVRLGTPMARILKWIRPDGIIYMIETEILAAGPDFCLKCMREAGVSAYDILVQERNVDVVALRDAAFSLNDLVRARERLPRLTRQPPVTRRTMFDSQLKQGGFSARDFRDAGFEAHTLSYNHFWQDGEDMTPGEIEWEETHAFFEAVELRRAGYTATELQRASFRWEDLREAGYTARELEDAIPAKARPATMRRRS